IQRILDHDGAPGEAGGIEAWRREGGPIAALADTIAE
ncbi:pyrroloquinoline quinone biosynthesis protein C, partial [Bacillus sp. S34]|nr:pyrroloquinoline quinone biosynthesis protein C [Bacillus sp. S34]